MALRTPEEYRASLRDGRRLVYRGELVEDVATHPSLGRTVDHGALLFAHPDAGPAGFWSYYDEEIGEEVSTYFLRPTTPDELRWRGDVIEESTKRCKSSFNIIKAVGTDALLGLGVVAAQIDAEQGTDYSQRIADFRSYCARNDLAIALAATDPKGDRMRRPHEQADPDLHLRIVDRDQDGIVVRGAKLHTTASPSANELICIPGRALSEQDADYAVAFAVPLNAPGLTMISHPLVDGDPAEHPVSASNIEVETLTVFEDVRVPWDRVFLCGEWQHAGAVATRFALFHRYTAISYKPPLIDVLVGAAALAADQLGIAALGHVREKLGRLIVYGELIRDARLAAAVKAEPDLCGVVRPYSVAVNAGKFHFASGFHEAVSWLQDIAGGLVVTAPGAEDLAHPEYGPMIEKYLVGRAGVTGRERWELAELVRDLTASEFGGYNLVVTLHGEGSMQAQLLQTVRDYPLAESMGMVRTILSGGSPGGGSASTQAQTTAVI